MRSHFIALATALVALGACVSASGQTPQPAPQSTPQQSAYRGPDLAAQRAAMDRLAPLVGRWQGEGRLLAPEQMTLHQTELVERDLDGLVLVVHGVGYADASRSGDPVFQALAVMSYDDRRGHYEVRAYNHGYATIATANFLDDGSFRWTIDAGGPVRMRYTVRFDAETWRENGEMSVDGGATWTPTVSLNLTRAP
jgi:hypothetical protein